MTSKLKRSGGKFGGKHSTYIPAALTAADTAVLCESVTNVSPGIIQTRRAKGGNRKHVKIIDMDWGILLSATDGSAHQEVHVYASDTQSAKLCIACGARNNGLTISFGKQTS